MMRIRGTTMAVQGRTSLVSCRTPFRASSSKGRAQSESVQTRAVSANASLTLATASCCLPHPDKVATGGEDAFFIAADKNALGVADGVGGWQESGVDPGEYSRSFMRTACEYFDTTGVDRGDLRDMKCWEEMARESLAVAHQKTRIPGSSTACVLLLNARDCWVSAANLGDSGFVLVRNGTVIFRTPALQHFFDCPLQFGAFPEHVEATDYPSDAQTYSMNVLPGDVIVMGSDGLFDNLPIEEILPLLPDADSAVNVACSRIASAARAHADDEDYASPYITEALNQGMDLPWWEKVLNTKFVDGQLQIGQLTGGKMDDITVLVARVTEASS